MVMDYSGDCCKSALGRTVPRGYDSSKLECVCVVCAFVCETEMTKLNMLCEEIQLKLQCVFLTGFAERFESFPNCIKQLGPRLSEFLVVAGRNH